MISLIVRAFVQLAGILTCLAGGSNLQIQAEQDLDRVMNDYRAAVDVMAARYNQISAKGQLTKTIYISKSVDPDIKYTLDVEFRQLSPDQLLVQSVTEYQAKHSQQATLNTNDHYLKTEKYAVQFAPSTTGSQYKLSHRGSAKDERIREQIESARTMIAPMLRVYMLDLPKVLRSPDFRPLSAEREEHADRSMWRISYVYHDALTDTQFQGWSLVDPSRGWALVQAAYELPGFNLEMSVDYDESATEGPIVKRTVMTHRYPSGQHVWEYEMESFSFQAPAASVFDLRTYGLGGLLEPVRPWNPLLVIVPVLLTLLCLLIFLVLRQRRRVGMSA